jgi:hypothetical protein
MGLASKQRQLSKDERMDEGWMVDENEKAVLGSGSLDASFSFPPQL